VKRSRGSASQRYVPMTPGGPLWRAIVSTLTVVNVATPVGQRLAGEGRWQAARREASAFVRDAWGPEPIPETRLGHRNFLHGSLVVGFFALAIPSVVAYGVGTASGADWLRTLGALALGLAALPLGLDAPTVVRGFFTNLDFHRWNQAGRPSRWAFDTRSQPRSGDLIWALVLGALFAWFFVKLALG